jgi:hypothetical protein
LAGSEVILIEEISQSLVTSAIGFAVTVGEPLLAEREPC